MKVYILICIVIVAIVDAAVLSKSLKKSVKVANGTTTSDILDGLIGLRGYSWVDRDAGTLPYRCNFVYGGGSNRLLYVGRVWSGKDVIPAAIHHYGKGGTETVRFIKNGTVNVQTNVQWLCSDANTVSWVRVKDFSAISLVTANALPVGYNSTSRTFIFGCLAHSFYSDQYPASLGTIKDGGCEFEVQGKIVNTNTFDWWYTLEVLGTVF